MNFEEHMLGKIESAERFQLVFAKHKQVEMEAYNQGKAAAYSDALKTYRRIHGQEAIQGSETVLPG